MVSWSGPTSLPTWATGLLPPCPPQTVAQPTHNALQLGRLGRSPTTSDLSLSCASFRPAAAGLGPEPVDPAHFPVDGCPGWISGPSGGPAYAAVVSLQVSKWVSGLGAEEKHLEQGWAIYGPGSICIPLRFLIRPSKH